MNKVVILGFLIANCFLTNFANASANYSVYIYNRSGYPVDISKGQTTCINRIDSISSSLKKFTKNPPDGTNFTFEDKNTFGGSCDGAEKSVEINVNFIGSGRTQGIIKIEHAKQNGDWSTKVSSASYGIHVTSAACYDHNKSHNCNDVWYKSSNDLIIKLDINVDGVTPPPHPISDDTDPISIGLGDISYYDSFGNSKKFDDIKNVTSGHYTVNFSRTTAACVIVGNSSSIGTYMECDKSIQARTVKDKNNNNRLVFLCTNDKANEKNCPWVVKKLNSTAYLGQSIYS